MQTYIIYILCFIVTPQRIYNILLICYTLMLCFVFNIYVKIFETYIECLKWKSLLYFASNLRVKTFIFELGLPVWWCVTNGCSDVFMWVQGMVNCIKIFQILCKREKKRDFLRRLKSWIIRFCWKSSKMKIRLYTVQFFSILGFKEARYVL